MKRTTQLLGIALVGVATLPLALNASANCGSDISFGSYYSAVTGTANGPALRSNFWTLGLGNPTLGAGVDNGPVSESDNWLVPYNGALAVLSGWAQKSYDGCPDAAGQPLPPDQRMVMSFSDIDVSGNMTYAVACAHRDTQAGAQFDFTRPPGGQGSPPIALVRAQKASITNTIRGGNEATITVGVPNFSAGFYSDGSSGCDLATVIPQFDVYKQQTARNAAPAATLDATVGGPWTLVGTCNSTGSPTCVVFTTTCGTTNCDNYLAVVPHYNSNFTTAEAATGTAPRVSPSSTRVQAGPILAVTPKPKAIPNPRVEAPRTRQDQ
jgi:hypothetical protein